MLNLPAERVTPQGAHHFFGYYDKSPWDGAQQRLLALEIGFMERPPAPEDVAVVGVVHLASGEWSPLAETRAWNWQQGCMLRWLPGTEDREIIFNDRQEGQFVAVVLDLATGQRRILPRPVYAVSPDGRSAVTLNFSRLHHFRPGYGYPGLSDGKVEERAPADLGIWNMDLATGEDELVVPLAELASFRASPRMAGSHHWVNHLQFNPRGDRFIFLHRWSRPPGWLTRLYTAGARGEEWHLLADEDLVSHFDWAESDHVLAWSREGGEDHFHRYEDHLKGTLEAVGPGVLDQDGHCSYSPDGRWILSDTYPDEEQRRTLLLYEVATGRRVDLGRFYAPPELGGQIRCDLHPRWSPDGQRVCFDSAHEGVRQMYVVEVAEVVG